MDTPCTCIVCHSQISPDYISLCDNCMIHTYEEIDIMEMLLIEDEPYFDIDPDEEEVYLRYSWHNYLDHCLNEDYDDFDLYEHFGIPYDIPESQQEGLLEAAIGKS
jgi:hypothetical protein